MSETGEPEHPRGGAPASERAGGAEPRLTNRQMLAVYFGFSDAAPQRPPWKLDLYWIVPLFIGLSVLLIRGHSPAARIALDIVCLAFFLTVVYAAALRVRYVKILEAHGYGRLDLPRDD